MRRLACRLLCVLAALGVCAAVQAQEAPLDARVEAIFARSCALSGCHAGPIAQMSMNLEPGHFRAATIGVSSLERPELMRVHPGRPDSSYLVHKIRGAEGIVGVPMPFTGERLTEAEMETVEAWVAGLAPETSAAPAMQRELPFLGWKVVNLPTARRVDRGVWLFLISHRFVPPVGTGYDTFFGLDGSGVIRLSLGWAATDRLLVALSRSNAANTLEFEGRYALRPAGARLGAAATATVGWVTSDPAPAQRLKGALQLSLTHGLGRGLGVALVPGVLLNPDETAAGDAPTLTLGMGARWRLTRRLALVGEWVPIVSGYTRTRTMGLDNRFDSWGGGLEIATPGHVFQIVLANGVGLTTDQYLRGSDLDVRDAFEGDLRLGFNIFRLLRF